MIGILILIVFVIAALLLIGLVLLQDEQGEGLGGIFGGGNATPLGSQSTNVLTKFTRIVAVIFVVSAFTLGFVYRSPSTGNLQEAAGLQGEDGSPAPWWQTEMHSSDEAAPDDSAE